MYNLFGNYTKKTLYSPLPFFVINEGTQGSHHVVLKEFKISHPPSPPRPSSLSLHHYPWLPFIASIYPCFLSPPYSVAFALCVYPWTDIHLRSLFFPQLVLTFQLSPCSAPPLYALLQHVLVVCLCSAEASLLSAFTWMNYFSCVYRNSKDPGFSPKSSYVCGFNHVIWVMLYHGFIL